MKNFLNQSILRLALFFPPTSHDNQFYGVTSGFTRLIMKSDYAWPRLICPHANFHKDRTMKTVTLLEKGGRKLQVGRRKGKRALGFC